MLQEEGLGEREITLQKSKEPAAFREALFDHFPKLKEGCGFELLRSLSRTSLDFTKIPNIGYHTQFLADDSGMGYVICYIRPLRTGLCLDPLEVEEITKKNCMLMIY